MKFLVIFKSDLNYAASRKPTVVGLAFLRQARCDAGAPDLPLARVRATVRGMYIDPEVSLTETEASEAKHYEYTSHVVVTVPDSSLNEYISIQSKVDRNSATGEINYVQPIYTIDKDLLKADWLKAGAPLEWEPRS